ncbi:MAG: hypothetical protein ACJASL_000554 [Paraglaciecola sp.]|jgi:hypothetical protein
MYNFSKRWRIGKEQQKTQVKVGMMLAGAYFLMFA